MRFSMCYACAFWSIAMHLRALDLPTEKWHVLTIFSSCFCCCDLAWMVGDLAIIQEAARQLYIYDIIYIRIKTEANCLRDAHFLIVHASHFFKIYNIYKLILLSFCCMKENIEPY
jgi:hypothetical protein